MNFALATGVTVLQRTPATLRAFLGGLPPDWIVATEKTTILERIA